MSVSSRFGGRLRGVGGGFFTVARKVSWLGVLGERLLCQFLVGFEDSVRCQHFTWPTTQVSCP